jgi:hypothetical protein
MSTVGSVGQESVTSLLKATRLWVDRADGRALERWIEGQLDGEGVPRNLELASWPNCLVALADARRSRPDGWPEILDARIEGFVRSALRFSRPGGDPVFGAEGSAEPELKRAYRSWAEWLSDPGLSRVVGWWFPARSKGRKRPSPPPLPAWSAPDRPLAVLRADWTKPGGFVTVDHRMREASATVEVFALGKPWIGPTWSSGGFGDITSRPKRLHWSSDSSADLVEWGFRSGPTRVVRSALLLRGRQLALLSEEVTGGANSCSMRLELSKSVTAAPIAGSRGLILSAGRSGPSTRVLPIGLPRSPYPTERGSFGLDDGSALQLRQQADGRRIWLPLLISWNPWRNRRKAEWRSLTVTERSRICRSAVAFAVRVAWGRDESLVIYRSLARPALRAFLGHQTRARFLVGVFTRKGEVEPILTVEE